MDYNSTQFMSQITDNVWLGSQPATMSFMLEKANIKHVVSMGESPIGELSSGELPNITYYYFPITDSSKSTQMLQLMLPQIHAIMDGAYAKKEPLLVHCKAGISRSPTVVITWLIHRFGWSAQQAFDFVKERRPCVAPNIGFMQLISGYSM